MNRPKRILIVEDEPKFRAMLADIVGSLGYEVETATDGFEALAKVKLDIDLLLLDAIMPGMDGFQVVENVRSDPDCSDLPIIMLTALGTPEDHGRALNAGANDFVSKPFRSAALQARIATHLRSKETETDIKGIAQGSAAIDRDKMETYREALERMAEAQRTTYQAHLDTIRRLATAAEYRDDDTGAHIHRIGDYCAVIARGLRLAPHEVEILQHAAPIHDVGKIGIPDSILLKPARLTPEETDIMRQHTVIGHGILRGSSSELLQAGEVIALSHHEKWDGTGYPNGVAGDDIPLQCRICAVADVFDALTSRRPYKEPFSNDKAYGILREDRGSHFDPQAIDAFFEQLDEVEAAQERYHGWE